MDFDTEKRKRLTKWIIGVATVCILIYLGVQNIGSVLAAVTWFLGLIQPLLLGLIFALILNVPMGFLEAHLFRRSSKPFGQKLRRPLALILSILLIAGVVVGVIWLVIPILLDAVTIVINGIIDLINSIAAMDQAELAELPFGNLLSNINWNEIITGLQAWLKAQGGAIMGTAFGTISSFVGGVVNFFIGLVFALYILCSKEVLREQFTRLIRAWLPRRFGTWLLHASSVAASSFRNFVSGQTLEAMILAGLCIIGMLIIGVPYAPMVGALVGVTALVPVVGAFIGAVVSSFMILTVSPIKALIFLVFFIILQQFEGNLIYPRVMGRRVKLPAMWILAAVTIGGGIAGPVGMLLGVPAASAAYTLTREATEKRERKAQE